MSKIQSRLDKMLMCQTVGSLVVSVVSLFFSAYFCISAMGFNLLSFISAGLLSWFTIRIGIFLTMLFFQAVFYKGDKLALLKDATEAEEFFKEDKISTVRKKVGPTPDMLKVIKTDEKPIGTFQDVPFYEWIEVMGRDGKSYRFIYSGTDNSKAPKKRPVPENCIYLPPGILYQVAPEVNTTA